MSTQATTCRRCSECANSEHHWLDNDDFGNDLALEALREASHCCKHCPALGLDCGACDGDGCDPECDPDVSDDPPPCPACGGEGVIYTGIDPDWSTR